MLNTYLTWVMEYLKKLLNESGNPSLTRHLSIVSYGLFVLVTLYLVANNQTWGHYETFTFITAGGGLGMQLSNKLIDSKFNSEIGQMPDKNPLG